jgi:ferritin-like metal-binding protein YciE
MTCKAMKGILEEAEEMINATGAPAIKDAGLVSAMQRIEHYEMAGYGCARAYAEMRGEDDSAELLQETLNEERATDENLTELAERLIHAEAAHV